MTTNFNCHETPKIEDLYNELGLLFPGEIQGDISELIGAIMQLCNVVKEQESSILDIKFALSEHLKLIKTISEMLYKR